MSNNLWSIVLITALYIWIFSVIIFIFKVFTGRGQFDVKAARIWGGAVLFSFGIWIAGLLNA